MSGRIDDLTVMGMMRGENSNREMNLDTQERWGWVFAVSYYGFIGWLIFHGLTR
jgi:hypothetical protein